MHLLSGFSNHEDIRAITQQSTSYHQHDRHCGGMVYGTQIKNSIMITLVKGYGFTEYRQGI